MVKRRPGTTPTLEEVAALAGVGRGTVSRVINNETGVKESTRRAVQQAIAWLGYVPNLAARSLAGRRADAVALAITEKDWRKFGEPFFSEVVRAVGDALADTSVQLLLTLVRSDAERIRFVGYARGGRVGRVPLMSVHAEDPLPDMLADAGLPTVLLGRRSGEEQVTYVDADNAGGARASPSPGWVSMVASTDVARKPGTLNSLGVRTTTNPIQLALWAGHGPVVGVSRPMRWPSSTAIRQKTLTRPRIALSPQNGPRLRDS